ncbi:YggS family pyridoxal phosphate-dependent enzyme [Thermodesulfatator autotrophicus]|uniref:Pyridoxal phosphate homeostasis protein n=1 Tax=Thermodesulfatator autotrophicus TaxID=1795632 RepID=A0A177E601_9BACT|nr:YggS family pyridoxal phosphate-dependent enzyme [Thermodesulfatator autotrophicus]OAG27393.1 pyridoxal phosphate biosynthesis protein [Thermodesulfatator autotrophicus]
MGIKERLTAIREKIARAAEKAGRKPEEIKLLGASKTQPPEKIREAFEAGLSLFGENYVQEAKKKKEALADLPLTWHLIGYLQRNKARDAIKIFDLIETVDRKAIAAELEKRAARHEKIIPVFIEVNVGGEETKAGVAPEDLPALVEYVLSLSHLSLEGLMTIPPYRENPEDVRPFFVRLRELKEDIERRFPEAKLRELSMGMSHDFHVAVEEGATIVRVGTALFGPRPKK